MARILIVCTGNICRSPAAEVMLQDRLIRDGLSDWKVESAGTWALVDRPATDHMVTLMAEQGLDLSQHRARNVNRQIVERADLVLTMAQGHAEALRLEFPDQAHKVYLLSEMRDGRLYDVPDPYGGSLADYRLCVAQLSNLIESGLARIKTLVENKSGGD